jgi:hypothetical protein
MPVHSRHLARGLTTPEAAPGVFPPAAEEKNGGGFFSKRPSGQVWGRAKEWRDRGISTLPQKAFFIGLGVPEKEAGAHGE